MMNLAKRFNLTLVDEVAAQPAGSFDTLYFDGHYYSQAQADRDFVPVNAVLQQQVNAAPSTTYNSFNATGYYLDQLSVYGWIEKYVPGGHNSQLGRYLNSAYNQEYGLDTPVQSSLNLVYLLGYQPPTGPWQIYGLSDERYSILGGNQLLPEAIAAALPSGSVMTQWALTSIRLTGRRGYYLTFKTPDGSTTVEADEVILTLPFSVLRCPDRVLRFNLAPRKTFPQAEVDFPQPAANMKSRYSVFGNRLGSLFRTSKIAGVDSADGML